MGIVSSATRGALAGVAATLAMDLVWYRRYRRDGGGKPFGAWEFSTDLAGFEDAPAPARLGKLIADAVGLELRPGSAGTVNNVVHWTTGIGWGKFAGLASAVAPVPPVAVGIATGVGAFATSYAALGAVGIYEPITKYDTETLLADLTAHLAFGSVLGLTLAVLGGRRRR